MKIKIMNRQVDSLVFLPVMFISVLILSIGGFIAVPNNHKFSTSDMVQLVLVIVTISYLLFVQLPTFRIKHLILYRVGLLSVSPCFITSLARLDWTLSKIDPHSFNIALTKWDAVYFAVTTLSTVGYGDIVPANQGTRIWLTFQIIIGVAFIAFVLQREITTIHSKRAT